MMDKHVKIKIKIRIKVFTDAAISIYNCDMRAVYTLFSRYTWLKHILDYSLSWLDDDDDGVREKRATNESDDHFCFRLRDAQVFHMNSMIRTKNDANLNELVIIFW